MIGAVEAAAQSPGRLSEVAGRVNAFIDQRKATIPKIRRGMYLATVRNQLLRVADRLDANGLSRLAWLFLLEGQEREARRWANEGLRQDRGNEYCRRLIDRLDADDRGQKWRSL